MKQFLEKAEFGVAAYERRLEALGAQQPAPSGHHAQGAPRRHRQRFAF